MGGQIIPGPREVVIVDGKPIPIEKRPIVVDVSAERVVFKDVIVERPVIKEVEKIVEVPKYKDVIVERAVIKEKEIPVERPVYTEKQFEIPVGMEEKVIALMTKAADHLYAVMIERLDAALESRLQKIRVPEVTYVPEIKEIIKEVVVPRVIFKDEIVKRPVFQEVYVDKPKFVKKIVEVVRIVQVKHEAMTPEEESK